MVVPRSRVGVKNHCKVRKNNETKVFFMHFYDEKIYAKQQILIIKCYICIKIVVIEMKKSLL